MACLFHTGFACGRLLSQIEEIEETIRSKNKARERGKEREEGDTGSKDAAGGGGKGQRDEDEDDDYYDRCGGQAAFSSEMDARDVFRQISAASLPAAVGRG